MLILDIWQGSEYGSETIYDYLPYIWLNIVSPLSIVRGQTEAGAFIVELLNEMRRNI